MPEKDPFTWAILWTAIPEPIKAAIIGAAIAFLRIMYDGREPRIVRRLLESALCGAIALCVAYLIEAVGLESGWAVFLGGAVGLIGADQVREWARRFAEHHVRKEEEA